MYSQLLNNAVLPLLLPLTRSRFWSSARSMRARQFWDADTIARFQIERLNAILDHAIKHVDFYRGRCGEARLPLEKVEDLLHFPITTKADILQNFPDRIVAADFRSKDWQYIGTGGTTNRVMVIHDFDKRDIGRSGSMVVLTEDNPYALGRKQVAIPPDACSSVCGIEGFRQRSVLRYLFEISRDRQWRDPEAISNLRGLIMNNWIERAEVLDPFGPTGTHIPDESLQGYLDAIRDNRPTLLMGLPQYLYALARFSLRTGAAAPRVKVIRPMGALMPPAMKAVVERAFQAEVREHYGSRELGGIAFDCKQRAGLHVLADQFVIEIVRDGQPVAPGGLGSVLMTDLQNFAMPLIRYEIGDMARLTYDECACGRQTPRIVLEGRIEDTIVTPSGSVLTPLAIAEFFYSRQGIDQFQLEEHVRKWEIRYVPDGDGPDEAALAEAFAGMVGRDRPLRLRAAKTILPEVSGKFRHVKSISFDSLRNGEASRTPMRQAH